MSAKDGVSQLTLPLSDVSKINEAECFWPAIVSFAGKSNRALNSPLSLSLSLSLCSVRQLNILPLLAHYLSFFVSRRGELR